MGQVRVKKQGVCEICGGLTEKVRLFPQGFNGKKWEYANMTEVAVPCCEECGDKIEDSIL